jgi:hypothetical protein
MFPSGKRVPIAARRTSRYVEAGPQKINGGTWTILDVPRVLKGLAFKAAKLPKRQRLLYYQRNPNTAIDCQTQSHCNHGSDYRPPSQSGTGLLTAFERPFISLSEAV